LLTHFAADRNDGIRAVEIFDANSGRWSTAVLSEARSGLAPASLPNQGLAIFAGYFGGS
jgi:hypothetical protein